MLCFAVIALALFTVGRSFLHRNDDHSREALLGASAAATDSTSDASEMQNTKEQLIAEAQTQSTVEDPTVVLYDNGNISVYHPYTTVTGAFGNIANSVVAELTWYVDGVQVSHEEQRLLVEGSTVSYDVALDPTEEGADTVEVGLEVNISGGDSFSASTMVDVERVAKNDSAVMIKTAEIPVSAESDVSVYDGADLKSKTATLSEGDTALILEYKTNDSGTTALRIQLPDGTDGWVDEDDVEISKEDCTTDEDYSEEMKVDFVNSMGYDSTTDYLVWVNLYTQKVNVFKGYQGNWALEECFDCATGKNTSPTTTGVYTYSALQDKWDLGNTYVKPVMVYNGGEAITSQPYDAKTDAVTDDTIGKPASGGSVRMQKDDIAWMAENIPVGTLVVVY